MFKSLFQWIKSLFIDAPPPTIKVPEYEDDFTSGQAKVAIVVGHNESAQGAFNYLGETEFSFNSRIANKLTSRLKKKGISAAIVKRPSGVGYSAEVRKVVKVLKGIEPDLAICLHFNAYSKKAYGCEMLVRQGAKATDPDWLLADSISDQLNEKLGLVERHNDGIKEIRSGHAGFLMINALHGISVPAVITEPCFANKETRESKIFFENEDIYVEILCSALIKSLKR